MILVPLSSPISLIHKSTKAENESTMNTFVAEIKKIYQYEIFKPILDLVATLCAKQRLTFSVYNRRFFELDNGNCRTIEGSSFNQMLNKVKSEKKYVITIKKTANPIIIHEIAHMMEKEGDFPSLKPFAQNIEQDIKLARTNNVSLKSAVLQVMKKEVETYPHDQIISELFARFFQITAMSKEVAGFDAEYGFKLNDVYDFFANTINYLSGGFYNTITNKIDPKIAQASKQFIVPIEQIKPKWSDSKRHGSIHESPNKPAWSRAVKSIKNNPFE